MSLASQLAGITDAGTWLATLEAAIGSSGGGGGGGVPAVSQPQAQPQTQTQTITRAVTETATPAQAVVTPDAVARRLQILNIIY